MRDYGKILLELEEQNNMRVLRNAVSDGKFIEYDGIRYLNLSSNDYLGLTSDTGLQQEFLCLLQNNTRFLMSNPSSRLMTGNSTDYMELEECLAHLFPGKSILVGSSGYSINTGILRTLTDQGDMIVADKLVHASLIDGLKLCKCAWRRYAHNDMDHLETILKKLRAENACNDIWIVTESVFSMDGDRAPLKQMVELKERYGARLLVDEAHALGVFGEKGAGLAEAYKVNEGIDIIIATMGKAMASYGGFAAVSDIVRKLMINKMRTLIFSTALPPINLMWTKFIAERLPHMKDKREHLRTLISRLRPSITDSTQIVPVMAYENHVALKIAAKFRDEGLWALPIRYPTVPMGKSRVRISLTAAMDDADIDNIIKACRDIG